MAEGSVDSPSAVGELALSAAHDTSAPVHSPAARGEETLSARMSAEETSRDEGIGGRRRTRRLYTATPFFLNSDTLEV